MKFKNFKKECLFLTAMSAESDSERSWFFIINPVSGKGKGLALWAELKPILYKAKIPFRFAISEYHQHTIKIVAQEIATGCRRFIGIGGDGTLNELINGIFSSLGPEESRQCIVALLPVGTGNDWIKSQAVKLNSANLIEHLAAGKTQPNGIGKLAYNNVERYFINVAGAGLDGSVVHEIEKMDKGRIKGRLSYLFGLIKGLGKYQASQCATTINNEYRHTKEIFLAAASLGRYFGNGMLISPNANAQSRMLDFTIVDKVSGIVLFPQLHNLFNGKIGDVSFVHKRSGTSMEVSGPSPLPIQADGEFVGEAKKVSFELIESGIQVLI